MNIKDYAFTSVVLFVIFFFVLKLLPYHEEGVAQFFIILVPFFTGEWYYWYVQKAKGNSK
jgi:hypothetical protein